MTKKFTINCDFGGQMAPFTIFIGRPEKSHHPLHFQADWLSKNRGGMIPGEVMEAVANLQKLADKNDVSLEDLCVYALGAEGLEESESDSEDTEDTEDSEQMTDSQLLAARAFDIGEGSSAQEVNAPGNELIDADIEAGQAQIAEDEPLDEPLDEPFDEAVDADDALDDNIQQDFENDDNLELTNSLDDSSILETTADEDVDIASDHAQSPNDVELTNSLDDSSILETTREEDVEQLSPAKEINNEENITDEEIISPKLDQPMQRANDINSPPDREVEETSNEQKIDNATIKNEQNFAPGPIIAANNPNQELTSDEEDPFLKELGEEVEDDEPENDSK